MADGWGSAAGNGALGVADDYTWVQLHTGAPGANGTANVATNSTRKQVTWGAAAGGVLTSTGDAAWSGGEVTATENYTHFTVWSASSSGTFGWSGAVTGGNVTAGTAFTIPSGSLTGTLTLAS